MPYLVTEPQLILCVHVCIKSRLKTKNGNYTYMLGYPVFWKAASLESRKSEKAFGKMIYNWPKV